MEKILRLHVWGEQCNAVRASLSIHCSTGLVHFQLYCEIIAVRTVRSSPAFLFDYFYPTCCTACLNRWGNAVNNRDLLYLKNRRGKGYKCHFKKQHEFIQILFSVILETFLLFICLWESNPCLNKYSKLKKVFTWVTPGL